MAGATDRRESRVLSKKPPGKATLTFARKQQEQFKDRTTAVAWQAKQHGGYEGSNVTAAITRDLHRQGFKIDQGMVRRSMDWLDMNGWAVLVVTGRRTTLFMMDPDVTVPDPAFVIANRVKERATQAATAPAAVIDPGLTGVVRGGPPMPRKHLADPSWMTELFGLVRDWYRADPETAEDWAKEALQWLR